MMELAQRSMTHPSPVPELDALVRQARRRTLVHTAGEVAVTAAIAALAVMTLVLVAGTALLHWVWVVAAALAAAAWSGWRKRARFPGDYRTAQRIDHALESKDLLSTAWHFAATERRSETVETVLKQAGEVASGADVQTLLPWKMPRTGYAAAALLAVCAVLLGVRLGVLKTLDLSSALVEPRFDTVTGAAVAGDKKTGAAKQAPRPFEGVGVDIPGYQASLTGNEKQEDFEQFEVDANEPGGQGEKGRRSQSGEEGQSGEAGEEGGDEPSAEEAPTGSEDPSRSPGDKGKNARPEKPNSLLDKMRDAFANMMEKMKIDSPGGEGKQQASNKQGQGQQKQQAKGQKGSQDAQQEGDGQKSDAEGEGAQTQQAKSGTEQPPEPPSGGPKSGVGSQDGSKDTKMAEDAEAMGKLSELLGRRSLNVKGEVMVEVTKSKNQSLRTPILDKAATHVESGGEVSRDDVPLHLQEYVQRYYERVRKAAPAQETKQ